MLMPKKVKYRRVHRGRRTGKASGGTHIDFGDFALQAMESCWMTNNQIEAARIAMTRHIRRGGKIWIRVFPDKPYTKKPAETRMGSGKGAPEGWVAVVKPGRILFEMAGVAEDLAKEAMRLAAHKLPIHVKFITRHDQEVAEVAAAAVAAQAHPVAIAVAKPSASRPPAKVKVAKEAPVETAKSVKAAKEAPVDTAPETPEPVAVAETSPAVEAVVAEDESNG